LAALSYPHLKYPGEMRFLLAYLFCSVFLICLPGYVFSQQVNELTGTILEFENDSPLPGANIYWEKQPQKGVVSDENGNFAISAIDLPAKLVVSYLGYELSMRLINEKDLGKSQQIFFKTKGIVFGGSADQRPKS
jgi:hypothetical protein